MPRSRSACVVRGPSRGRGHVVCGDCNLLRLGRFATGDLLWIKRIDVRIGAGRDDRPDVLEPHRGAAPRDRMAECVGCTVKPYGPFCTDTVRSYLIFAQKRVTSGVGALCSVCGTSKLCPPLCLSTDTVSRVTHCGVRTSTCIPIRLVMLYTGFKLCMMQCGKCGVGWDSIL